MRITFLKQYGPFSEGETIELEDNAAEQCLEHGVAVKAGQEVRHATAEPPHKRTAAKPHPEG